MQLTSSFGKTYSKSPQFKPYLVQKWGKHTALFVVMICSAIFLNILIDTWSQWCRGCSDILLTLSDSWLYLIKPRQNRGQGTNASEKVPIAESASPCKTSVYVSFKTTNKDVSFSYSVQYWGDCLWMAARERFRTPMIRGQGPRQCRHRAPWR